MQREQFDFNEKIFQYLTILILIIHFQSLLTVSDVSGENESHEVKTVEVWR